MLKHLRLTESDLHNIITEAVYRILENSDDDKTRQRMKNKPIKGYKSRNPYYNEFVRGRGMWNQDIKDGDKPYFPYGNEETKHSSKPSKVKKEYFNKAKREYDKLKNK